MTLPVALSDEAESDLEEATAWYERQAEGLGMDLVIEVRQLLTRIGDQPASYPEVEAGIRRAQVDRFSYGVFYRVREDRVEVIGVLHDRRSPRVWQRRAR